MLTLALLRHAKSSWDHPSCDDFDRPLAPRGVLAAPMMGRYIQHIGLVPDIVLCSTAQRTRETLALALPQAPVVAYDDDLYLASPSQLVSSLKKCGSVHRVVMMIGHNPGFHDLAQILAGPGLDEARVALSHKFPTAGLAVLRLPQTTWAHIGAGSGVLTHFMTPSRLQNAGQIASEASGKVV